MAEFDMDALLARLQDLSDPKYREFNEGLVPCMEYRSLGVRLPALRAIGRELLKKDWLSFLDASRASDWFELRMLHAIVLGGAKCPIEDKLALIDAFLPYVNNWAVCDTLCTSFKPRKSELDAAFDFVLACSDSPIEFRKRFGLIMMMNSFREPPYAERVMAAYRGFHHEGYYARMGAAWGLATLFLYRREDVLSILRDGVLDDFTHNKAIQKMCESYRVSDADKQFVRQLRRRSGRTGGGA